MLRLRAAILDDERRSREVLSGMLQDYCPQVEVVAEWASADEAREALKTTKINLLFLDISMPKESGIQFLNSLEKRNFMVVIVTAYNQFAIAAIRANALDYILKPVDHRLLISSVKRATKFYNRILRSQESYDSHLIEVNHLLSDLESEDSKLKSIVVPFNKSFERIELNKVVYLKASNNYTCFKLIDGNEFIVAKTLKEYSEILELSQFIRTHKSYLINKSHVRQLVGVGAESIEMINGDVLPIARRKRQVILQMFYSGNE